MGKIRINLAGGASTDKPLISAFTENGNIYVVLDNEINGSMGLPIILVSKYIDNKLVKITDQSEWQLVKEYLKNIIAGNKIEFVNLDKELSADDIYYTQLTLPVPSFDALKKAYTFNDEEVTETNPVAETINSAPEESVPVNEDVVVPEAPVQNPIDEHASEPAKIDIPAQDVSIPFVDINTPEVNNTVDVEPEINQNIVISSPSLDTPAVESTPIEVVPNSDVNLDNPLLNNLNMPLSAEEKPQEKEPEITPTPIIDSPLQDNVVVSDSLFKEQKEAFMQACENMFDALVQKFEKELENKNN